VIDSLVQIGNAQAGGRQRPRLPEWARKSKTHFESLNHLKRGLRELKLHTVCEEARCPNIHECFHRGAATFMILGELCTRGCGFCSVQKLNPRKHDVRLDPDEPGNVARMAQEMKLRYVVITSVNRDDLDDGGSQHFAETVRQVRRALPEARSTPVRTSSITIWRPCRGSTRGCGPRRNTGSRWTCWPSRGGMRRTC
jgi:lipoic acid synthetase